MTIKFCDLHLHSTFSVGDGFGFPLEIVKRAKNIGRDVIALTDHASVSGFVQLEKACKENKIKPIFGCESYIVSDLEKMYNEKQREKSHITILAKDDVGYNNLLKIASLAYSKGFYYRPTIDFKLLFEHQEGLIVLSGCWSGFLQKALRENKIQQAVKIAQEFKSVFGDRYYLETQHFPLFKDTINGLEYVSAQLDIPIVLTCDPHYLLKDQAEIQEIIHAIREKREFDVNKILYGAYQWPAEELFESVKIISPSSPWEKYFEDTYNVSLRCNVTMPKGGNPKFLVSEAQNSLDILVEKAKDGMLKRNINFNNEVYKERFERELKIINENNFVDYFLIVADIVNWAKEKGICTGAGRGSSAGSLISYFLGITEIDPIKYNLLLERFLQSGRNDLPDIDIDFESNRRNEVKEYISKKYGDEYVCNIGTFNTFKGRSALDDIRRVFNLPTEEINKIKSGLTEHNEGDEGSKTTIKEAFEKSNIAKEQLKKFPIIEKATLIEGQIRQMGEHAAGVIISNRPLTEIVAIYEREKENNNGEKEKTQFSCFEMNDNALIGLLKIDILGITELSILADICKIKGIDFKDLYKISTDDKETLNGFREIDVEGIFQFSGWATRNVLKSFKEIKNFEQLIASVALSKPGPQNSGITSEYLKCANGQKSKGLDWHPILKNITKDTFFQCIYQEQIMQICNELASMSWSDTDKIRKLVGKSQGEEVFEKYFIQFKDGCIKNGVTEKQARQLWDDIKKFGKYGFNRSHAVCYALLAFWSMYMKRHFPIEYYLVRLSKEKDEEKIKTIAKDAKNHGLKMLKPRLGKSEVYWKIEDEKTLRAGLTYLKGIGEKTAKALVENNYKSEEDFKTKKNRQVTKRIYAILKESGAVNE